MSDGASGESPCLPIRRPKWKRWFIVAAAILLAPLIAMAAFWFGPSPRVTRDHVRLVRGPDGVLAPETPSPPSGLQFEAHAGTLEAKDNMASSCVSSSGDHARLACRRWTVFNRSDHLLMRRTSDCLVENLKTFPYVERIDYYPPGIGPDEGDLAPDVAVVLDLKRLQESGFVWQSDVDADIAVAAGNRLACSNSFAQDSLTPPVLNLAWRGRLHHQSTTKGVTSSAAKYKQAAEHCAKQIADALRKHFDAEMEKHGALEKLPEVFYPAFKPPRDLPFGSDYTLERLAIWHGLMNRCDATWRLTTDQEPGQAIDTVRKSLEQAGWRVADHSGPPNARIRSVHGSAVLEIFAERDEGPVPAVETRAAGQGSVARSFYVHYLDRMTEKELAAAVDRAVREKAPLDVLMLFQHTWTPDQCRQILGRLEARRPRDPDGWLTMAEIYHRLQDTAKARDAVLKARALEPTVPGASGLSSRIESLAKSLGDPSLAKKALDAGLLKEAGFVQIAPGAQLPDREIAADEPACYYAIGRDGKPQILAVRLKTAVPGDKAAAQMTFVRWSEGSKLWSAGGMSHATAIEGVGTVTVTATPLSDGQRFRICCRVSPSAVPPPASPDGVKR